MEVWAVVCAQSSLNEGHLTAPVWAGVKIGGLMPQRFRTAAISDEFHARNFEASFAAMAVCGMTGITFRTIHGKNVLQLSDDELKEAVKKVHGVGMEVVSLATPIFKCALPGYAVDPRFPVDQFGGNFGYQDQDGLIKKAFNAAEITGARLLRMFTFLRTEHIPEVFDIILRHLSKLGDLAAEKNLIIGLENEHCTNFASGNELAIILRTLDHPNIHAVWDPANAVAAGVKNVLLDYRALPPGVVADVHVKNCAIGASGQPVWCPLNQGLVDWPQQIDLLQAYGYRGYLTLESHWPLVTATTDEECRQKLWGSGHLAIMLADMVKAKARAT